MEDKKVLCTLCARGGSKGLKNKNLLKICNKPLIAHTIEMALEVNFIDKVVVSTDSDQIRDISTDYGANCWYLRSKELSSDSAPKIPVIKDLLARSEKKFNETYDYVIDLDITSPLRVKDDILNSFSLFIESNSDNLITGCRSRKNPFFNMVILKNNAPILVNESDFKRRQDAPEVFDMNASIYIWKREVLMSKKNLFNPNTSFYEMPYERSIDIDSKSDFDYVEFLMNKANKRDD